MIAGAVFGLIILGITPEKAGVMRVPGGGRLLSGAALRMIIHSVPVLLGNVKFPVKIAPGSRAMTLPGCALLSAD